MGELLGKVRNTMGKEGKKGNERKGIKIRGQMKENWGGGS